MHYLPAPKANPLIKKSTMLLLLAGQWSIFSFGRQAGIPLLRSYSGTGAYSRHQSDVFSFSANPAALGKTRHFAAGLYGERKFLLDELSSYSFAGTVPAFGGGFGLSVIKQGKEGMNQLQAGLAYGRELGEKIAVGAQFNYHSIAIAGYGSAAAVTAEAGMALRLTEQLEAGFHISNPAGGRFGEGGAEKLPAVYAAGIGYDASEKVYVAAFLRKEESLPADVMACMQYRIIPQVMVKAGCQSSPALFWMGAGFQYQSLRIEAAASYHLQLGITPGVLFIFSGKNKKE